MESQGGFSIGRANVHHLDPRRSAFGPKYLTRLAQTDCVMSSCQPYSQAIQKPFNASKVAMMGHRPVWICRAVRIRIHRAWFRIEITERASRCLPGRQSKNGPLPLTPVRKVSPFMPFVAVVVTDSAIFGLAPLRYPYR